MRDDARPQPVVERNLAVLHLVLEVGVRERAVASPASSVSARSCVVTSPIAPRARSPRTTASAPMRRSCEFVPCEDLVEQEEQRERAAREVDELLQAGDLRVEARAARLERVLDAQRRARLRAA